MTQSPPQSPCRIENLSVSATHTHSAPGGYTQYAFYQIPTLGYSEEVVHAYVEGIAQAIVFAYRNVKRSTIRSAQSWLLGANRNRSPTSYLLNPQSERDTYKEEGDTDKTMTQLTFHSMDEPNVTDGLLNWFAVHGMSMNSSNHLISGDNKGYASYLMERYWNGNATLLGTGNFVAAFASTNLGDVSPNTAGPHCIDTGEPCDNGTNNTTTCHGKCHLCRATGPGKDMFESTQLIGRLQYEHALNLTQAQWNQQNILHGDVVYRHSFIDMSNLTVVLPNNSIVHTCPAALGYSFAAGTTDGPGQYPFAQGTNTSNHFVDVMGGFVSVPSKEQIQCQAPKPILLNAGQTTFPYHWMPSIIPISIFQIGQFFILNVPAEFTTMAGRRLRNAVRQSLHDNGFHQDPIIVIAGLSNSYSSYVTTKEEYTGQRYEAACTLYGPNTLAAYIQEFQRLTNDLMTGRNSTTKSAPRDPSHHLLSAGSGGTYPSLLSIDTIGIGRKFGSLVIDTNEVYMIGETVSALFRSANPRNNVRAGGTFLSVDVLNETDGTWHTQYVDGDWCTQYHWKGGWSSERFYWGNSFANITWTIPDETPNGMYRICHYGTRQTFLGTLGFSLSRWTSALLATTIVGLHPLSLLLQLLKTAYRFTEKGRQAFNHVAIRPTKDYHGCSRSFLVHG
jgi:neutral ceramidase